MNHVPIIPASTSPGAHPNPAHQVLSRLARLAATIVIVGLPGCDLFSTEHRVIGIINFDDSAWRLPRIPETATAGVPLEMAVWTLDMCLYRQGGHPSSHKGDARKVYTVEVAEAG